jgi:CheY-like chemotaxis protein
MPARILIVEDNKANLDLVKYLLEFAGYTTLVARNGEEGIRMARAERPDLVLSDLEMPVMDGYEMVRRLRGDPLTRTTMVIAVTASSMPGDRDAALAAGFDNYLSKPIDPVTFVQQVESFMRPERRARLLPSGA